MTNYDWVRWLFQVIPQDETITGPSSGDCVLICDGLHRLRNALKDADIKDPERKWEFVKLSAEVEMFKMGIKKIYWWIDPEEALLTNGEINAERFNEWTKKEYDRIVGIDR
jgi:soluble cytochrome b562